MPRAGEEAPAELVARARFGDDGLIPAVVQDAGDGRVLTLAYMNRAVARAHAGAARDVVLEPLAGGAVAQGGDQRQHPGGALGGAGL